MPNINPKPRTVTPPKPKLKNLNKPHSKEVDAEENLAMDVTEILHQDHLKVMDMFFQYRFLDNNREKQQLVESILQELYVHATVEEEIVYSKARKSIKEEEMQDILDEADTEHHVAKVLIAELSTMKPSDDHYDSKVTVLGECVRHHIEEEEKEMFEKMKKSNMDLEKLGNAVMERKAALLTEPVDPGIAKIWKELKEFETA